MSEGSVAMGALVVQHSHFDVTDVAYSLPCRVLSLLALFSPSLPCPSAHSSDPPVPSVSQHTPFYAALYSSHVLDFYRDCKKLIFTGEIVNT